jgi:hypothetical protein
LFRKEGKMSGIDKIKELLRDPQKLLSAREAEEVMRPITRFARMHMSHSQALMSMWPDLPKGEERTAAVKAWFGKLNPRLDTALDDWFGGDRSPELRSEFLAATFREAIANSLACAARKSDSKSKLWRERYTGRAMEIADVLTTQVDTTLAKPALERGIIIIIVWGEHGAHFPDS